MLARGLCGFLGGAALTGIGYLISRKLAKIGLAIDDAFAGDCWNCPPDVEIGGQQKPGGEAGGRPATDIRGEIAPHGNGL